MTSFDPYDSLVPIYIETTIPKRVVQIGTAVFIVINNEPFLFTVAHVTDEINNGELLVPTISGLLPIDGYMAHIDLLPEMRRSEDIIDLAYYRLSSLFAKSLSAHFQPLPQQRSELILSALELSVCSVSGYPASKSKKKGSNVYTSEIYSYRGVAADDSIYQKHKLNPDTNIIINFNKKQSVSPIDGEMYLPPKHKGVSGGAIFAWPHGQEISEDWSLPKLVGIFHTYKETEGLMIGTSLIGFMSAITLGQMKGYGGIV